MWKIVFLDQETSFSLEKHSLSWKPLFMSKTQSFSKIHLALINSVYCKIKVFFFNRNTQFIGSDYQLEKHILLINNVFFFFKFITHLACHKSRDIVKKKSMFATHILYFDASWMLPHLHCFETRFMGNKSWAKVKRTPSTFWLSNGGTFLTSARATNLWNDKTLSSSIEKYEQSLNFVTLLIQMIDGVICTFCVASWIAQYMSEQFPLLSCSL